MSKRISIAIVDDHQIVIDGLLSLFDGEHKYHMRFATTKPETVAEQLAQTPVDVLLTDVQMPVMPGNELAKIVRRDFPEVRILALSMSGVGEVVDEMIRDADIAGYVLKNIGRRELFKAIDKIADGGIYFSDAVLEELRKTASIRKENVAAHLSDREIEILSLIEKEHNNRVIGDMLFISERTVETHRKNIFRKTGTNSVIGLIKWAYEHKVIA